MVLTREIRRTNAKKGKIKEPFFVPKIISSNLSKKNVFTIKEERKIKSEKRNIGNKEDDKIWKFISLFSIFTILIIEKWCRLIRIISCSHKIRKVK